MTITPPAPFFAPSSAISSSVEHRKLFSSRPRWPSSVSSRSSRSRILGARTNACANASFMVFGPVLLFVR